MIGMRSLVAFAAIVSVAHSAAVFAPEDEWHHTLLKRQEPGTPAYACHEACGTAITLSRGPSPCTNNEFLTDYADCLVCSGPDNFNIWRYYGATLTIAGTKCGLSTTPVSGAPSSTSSSSSATATSSIPELDTESTVTAQPDTSSGTTQSTSAPESASESASISSSAVSTTAASTSTAVSTSSVTMTAGNSTSTTVPFTGGAESANGKMAGALAVVAGAIFAAAL